MENEVKSRVKKKQDLKRNKDKNKNKKKGFFKRLFNFIAITFLFIITISSLGILGAFLLVDRELENMPSVDAQYLKTYPVSEITDKNGSVIWKPTDTRVEPISYEEIPELYKDILISVEDKEFWESKGVSPKGIFNMVVGTARSKLDESYKARGGSTIDQQLIKNKYFDRGYGHNVVTRKIQEIFFSLQLNENFSKEEILEFYVNDLEFAERAKGIKTIMKTYYNKSPEDFKERTIENIAEQAFFAGLSQAPTTYNLYTSPEEAKKRTLTVLGIALENGVITQEEYNDAKNYDLTTNLKERNWESKVQQQKNLKYKTYTDGVKKELANLGYNLSEVSIKIQSHLDPEVYGKIENQVKKGSYYLDKNQQIGVTVLNTDGIVVGMVGSRYNDELNRATQISRSTGSSTKPLLAYAPLLQYFGDKYTTASKFDTSNYKYPGSSAVMHNFGQGTYGYQTMHKSLINSFNTPVARIMDGVLGSNKVRNFLAGMDLDVQEKFTSVDGLGIHASSLQVAAAYNSLNDLGEYTAPRFINKIIFNNGEEKVIEPTKRKAMNPSVAWTVNHMLRSVPTDEGTAADAKIPGFDGYAGKTGTVGFAKSVRAPAPYGIGASDLWYNSITNQGYSISIWTGYDKPNTSPQMPSSYSGHKRLGRDLQKMLNQKRPVVWKKPDGVVKIAGEGKDALYKVTDSSREIIHTPEWIDLESYKKFNFNEVSGNKDVNENWKEIEDSKWFDYYNNNEDLNPIIINEDFYNKLKGSE